MSDDKRLERIENKIDKLTEHLGSIDVTLGVNTVSLQEHMRRTALLEEKMTPLTSHVNMVNGVIKFLAFLAAISGLIATFLKWTGHL